jgi:hypothetical protein
LSAAGDTISALENQDRSLEMMRNLSATYPEDPYYRIDVVRALDLRGTYLTDATAEFREALAILEEMQANGTLPAANAEWIPAFRKSLGLPTEF